MSYQPSTWNYETDAHGNRTYQDEVLNKVQENLLTLSSLIGDMRVDAELNIPIVQGWAQCKTVKDPTAQTVALFASKIIEGLGVVFTAGTPAAIIATITSKIVSGLITHFANPQSKDTYNQLQAAASDLKLSIDKHSFFIQKKIGTWLDNLETEWDTPIGESGNRLSDLAVSEMLPRPSSTEYVECREKMNEISTYETAKVLIPRRWRIRKHRGFPPDGISNLICGWQVEWYKVRGRGTWDSWRSSSEFPKIPNHLKDDIEGPYEPINWDNIPNGKQRFTSWGSEQRDYEWSDGQKLNDSKQWNGTRWMGFSGRNYPYRIENDNLLSGTSFLDLIEDILSGVYSSYSGWVKENSIPKEPSYYLWYRTKRPNESVEIVNDRRDWTLLGNWACQDWVYDSNSIFTWGRAYRGITLNHYSLVDENGDYAPAEFCYWLFKDDGHGKIKNEDGVAEISDFYHNWGLNFE